MHIPERVHGCHCDDLRYEATYLLSGRAECGEMAECGEKKEVWGTGVAVREER